MVNWLSLNEIQIQRAIAGGKSSPPDRLSRRELISENIAAGKPRVRENLYSEGPRFFASTLRSSLPATSNPALLVWVHIEGNQGNFHYNHRCH